MNCYIRDKSENPTNGIYKIVNSITKKVYIGRSDDIEARWKEHKKDLKKKKHYNKELQNDWNTYGKDNFSFEIIEKCSYSDTKYRELYYMFQFDNVYNKVSNKEKITYNLTESLNEIKLKKYNDLKFYYQITTKYNNTSLSWNLSIKYKRKIILIYLYNSSIELTKNRFDYVDSQQDIIMIRQNLAYKDQLINLNDNLITQILNVLNN